MSETAKIITVFFILVLSMVFFTETLFLILFLQKFPINSSSAFIKLDFMTVRSSAFENYQLIPSKYTCDGENVNPPIQIEFAPAEAKSLVLVMDDPDASIGVFEHWLVWNINPRTTQIGESSVPLEAVLGTTDFGKTGYGGPCPGSGVHRYFFKVFALDTVLDLPEGAKNSDLQKAMKGHILTEAELIGKYERQK